MHRKVIHIQWKLETQGHTLAKAIGDSDDEFLESVWCDDTALCSEAFDYQFELKHFKANVLLKDEGFKREAHVEDTHDSTQKLIELQCKMQQLFEIIWKSNEI